MARTVRIHYSPELADTGPVTLATKAACPASRLADCHSCRGYTLGPYLESNRDRRPASGSAALSPAACRAGHRPRRRKCWDRTRTRRETSSCRPSAQFLVHDDVLFRISIEHAQPALAAVNAHALTALGVRVSFDLTDQRQPALHVAAAADRDDADLADLRIDQDGGRGGFHRSAVPGHPQQAAAGENVGFDISKGIQPGAATGCLQQRADMRPELADPCGVDADELNIGGHRGNCAPSRRNYQICIR